MKNLLIAFTLTLIFFPIQFAQADDTSFGGSGSAPMPIEQANVKMMDEHIVIRGDNINLKNLTGAWHYSCDFTFKNISNHSLSLQMGFPFPVSNDESSFTAPRGTAVKLGGSLVHDFIITIDGKRVSAQWQKIGPNLAKNLDYQNAYLWKVNFAPQQIINIHHEYTTGVTYDVVGHHYVQYVLKTGGLWNGHTIGHAKIEIIPNVATRMCTELDDPNATYLKPTPSGVKITGTGKNRKYSWDIKNLQPTEDLNFCFQTAQDYVHYHIVNKILGMNGDNFDLNKETPEKLRFYRNAIYAQYGKHFQDPKLQTLFEQQWWYEVNNNYSDQLLTQEDKKALTLIMQAETNQGTVQ